MSNVPHNVNDGNLTTRWSHTMPTWIQMDVGFVTRISFIKVAWYNAASVRYNFNVEISSTGAANTFTKVIEGQSTTATGLQTINFTDTTGRYVRVNVLSAVSASTPIPQTSRVKYAGGPIPNKYVVDVYNIFWGAGWNDTTAPFHSGGTINGPTTRTNLINHTTSIANSDLFDILWQYGNIKGVRVAGNLTWTGTALPGGVGSNVTLTDLQTVVNDVVNSGQVPDFDAHGEDWVDKDGVKRVTVPYKLDYKHIYFIFIDPSRLNIPGAAGIAWIGTNIPGNNNQGVRFMMNALAYSPAFGSWNGLQLTEQAWAHEVSHLLFSPGPGLSLCSGGNGVTGHTAYYYPSGGACYYANHSELSNCSSELKTLSGTSIAVPSYWSDMDGRCVAPSTGDNSWIRPPAATTIAGITELEVFGQTQTPPPPPPPTIPPPGPGPSPPPAPPAPSPPAGSLDTDGVAILYQKNMNPGMFHKNIKDLNIQGSSWQSSTFFEHDCANNDTAQRIQDGNFIYWHMHSREGSFASGGSNWTARPEWVSTRDATQAGIDGARQRGYLANQNDPKNVEMTAIIRINNIVNERPSQHDLSMKTRGDNHVDDNEKTLQVMGKILYNDVSRHTEYYGVEITHPNVREEPVTFVSPFTATNHPQIPEGVWIGLKLVIYNVNNNSGIHMEYWVDTDPLEMLGAVPTGTFKNQWKKVWIKEEARSDTPVWGGPRSQLRIDMCEDLYMAAYSLHEIIPPTTTTTTTETSPPPSQDIQSFSSQKESKKQVKWY